MNYLLQINAFWEKFLTTNGAKPYHAVLYFALLHINNKCRWKRQFAVSFPYIIELTKLDKNSYLKACIFLFENDFLEMYQKGKNQYECATFSIKVLSDISESTNNENIMHTESTRNINKHIKQEKELKKEIKQQDFFEIFNFFKQKILSEEEAQKFINFNESRGWKNIENWQPLAENWILNIKNNQKNIRNGNLKTNTKNSSRYFVGKQNYNTKF